MNIYKNIDNFILQHQLIKPHQTIIVGLSGGPDSVFLLHYLQSKQSIFNIKLIAAHLDHEWREDSHEEALFCKQLCNNLNIQLITKKLSELAINIKPSGSKEQDARTARRYFFKQITKEHDADAIALAQHKNDQEETFFIRLLRGSSLTGLCAMWPKKGMYIRPLLITLKKDIIAWLDQHRINYLVDPTNVSDDFLRNRIRNQLIPTINKIDSRFSTTFVKTIERLQQTESFLEKLTLQTFNQITQLDQKKSTLIIDKDTFKSLDQVLQYRILVHWLSLEKLSFPATQGFLDELIRFINQPGGGTHYIHEDWHIIKKQNRLHINKKLTF